MGAAWKHVAATRVSGMMRIGPVLLGGGVTIAGLALRPEVTLATDSVEVDLPPAAVVQQFRDRMASGSEVIATGGDRLVRRFSGRAGRFRYATVEVVSFGPLWITFEHLRGPFASCSERFDAVPGGAGTILTHSGSFVLRGGVFTWPLARTAVKRAFEQHVREHMGLLANENPLT